MVRPTGTGSVRLSGLDDRGEADVSAVRNGFRQGFVFELIDRSRPLRPLAVHVMALNPSKYTLSEPFQNTLTPAEDDTVVAEENGIIVREINLEGTFGLNKKSARGFVGAQNGGNPLSGTEHFMVLRGLFRQYSSLKKDPARAANIELVFHALRDDDHFVVVPQEFATPRDASRTRMHYEYRISMTAIREATGTTLQPDEIDPDGVNRGIRTIHEAFHDARASVAEVTANIAAIRRKVGNVNVIMNNAIQLVNAVGAFLSGVTELIVYPRQLIASVVEGVADAADSLAESVDNSAYGVFHENARSLRRIEAAIDRIALFDDRFRDTKQRLEDLFDGERRLTGNDVATVGTGGASSAPGAGGATVGSRTRAVAGSSSREAGLDIARGTSLREVVLTRSDTLERIAHRAGTSPETLIVINNLRAPYLAPGGGPGVLAPGDVLLVPGVGGGGESARGSADTLSIPEVLYGIDLALDPNALRDGRFDLLVNEASNTSDGALVRGVDSLAQGIEITLGTRLGTTVFLPSVGTRHNIGARGTAQHVLLASVSLREALLQDPRISGIASSRIVMDQKTGELSNEISPAVAGEQSGVTFVLPFGTATGGG